MKNRVEGVYLLDADIICLGFSVRLGNCLALANTRTLRKILEHSSEYFLSQRMFGPVTLAELNRRLRLMGLELKRERRFR